MTRRATPTSGQLPLPVRNPTNLDLEIGDNIRWISTKTRQFDAGRVLEFRPGCVLVDHHGRPRLIPAHRVRLSEDAHTIRRRAERGAA